MVTSNLNQLLKVEGKKEFLKQSVRQWNVGAWLSLIDVLESNFLNNLVPFLSLF